MEGGGPDCCSHTRARAQTRDESCSRPTSFTRRDAVSREPLEPRRGVDDKIKMEQTG